MRLYALVFLSLTCGAWSPVASAQLGGLLNKLDTAVANTVNSTVAATVENSVTAAVTTTVNNTVAAAVDNAVTAAVANTVATTVNNTVAATVENAVTTAVVSTVATTVQNTVAATVENSVTAAVVNTVATTVDQTVSSTLENSVTSAVVNTVASTVEDVVTSNVVNTVTSTVANTLEQTVQATLDSKVGDAVTRTVDTTLDRVVGGVVQPVLDPVVNTVVEPVLEPVLDPVLQVVDPVLQTTLVSITKKVEQTFGNLPPVTNTPRDIPVENNWRAVENEWIALVSPEQLPALNVPAIRVIAATPLASTNQVMVRVAVSAQDNAAGRAQQVLRGLGATAADRNHVYFENKGPNEAKSKKSETTAATKRATSKATARVGLIDTALNHKHPSLKSSNIVAKDFVDGKKARPTAHGTGIASLLVGAEQGHDGLLPRGQLVAASVFYQGGADSTGAATSSLVAALDWMALQDVKVVNMSLAGPPNEVLGQVIDKLSKRGMLVVAAVGNDGPASRPLYPAAFEPVVAVTAVDQQSQIYRWANQGPQVDLAAWGVASKVAYDKGGYADRSGTSYAAPIVSARLAEAMANGAKSTSAALKKIIAAAEDLGAKGRDNTYGYGLIK